MLARFFVAVGLLLHLSPRVALAADGWRTVARESGALVMLRDVPGRSFPTFRAVWQVQENIYDVLAVLSDVERHTQWIDNNAVSRLLKKKSEFAYVVYSRTDAPWPVADRDAVYHSRVTVHEKERLVMVRFWAGKSARMPPVSGVVRMSNLRGYYGLKMLGPKKTQVDYEVDADPAGWIPTWIGKIALKKSILKTVRALRERVKKTRGWYHKRIKRWRAMNRLPAL